MAVLLLNLIGERERRRGVACHNPNESRLLLKLPVWMPLSFDANYYNTFRGVCEAVLGLHDSNNLENGGQPEVYNISFIIEVMLYKIIFLDIIDIES